MSQSSCLPVITLRGGMFTGTHLYWDVDTPTLDQRSIRVFLLLDLRTFYWAKPTLLSVVKVPPSCVLLVLLRNVVCTCFGASDNSVGNVGREHCKMQKCAIIRGFLAFASLGEEWICAKQALGCILNWHHTQLLSAHLCSVYFIFLQSRPRS